MVKTIIVDDEKKSREAIAGILRLYCENVELIAEADNIITAAEVIHKNAPHLVLLDVDMPGGNGFELLKQFPNPPFKVVFITAFQEYAVKAFKFSALDYLLKPINPDELVEAVNKTENILEKEHLQLKLETFLSNMENITKEIKKIVLKTSENIYVINVQDIVRCEADRNYTVFFISDGKKILVSNTLKEYEEMLGSYKFFRAHQSHLVNVNYIERFEKKEGGSLLMKDGSVVPVSVRKKETLLSMLDRI